jgi:hypothetical protein
VNKPLTSLKAALERNGSNRSPLKIQPGGSHYKSQAIQPVEYIVANKLPFIEGNIVKYITRWRNKGGVKDLEKIIHYVQLLIYFEEYRNAVGQNQEAAPECGDPVVCNSYVSRDGHLVPSGITTYAQSHGGGQDGASCRDT